jgi:hypothetical protein
MGTLRAMLGSMVIGLSSVLPAWADNQPAPPIEANTCTVDTSDNPENQTVVNRLLDKAFDPIKQGIVDPAWLGPCLAQATALLESTNPTADVLHRFYQYIATSLDEAYGFPTTMALDYHRQAVEVVYQDRANSQITTQALVTSMSGLVDRYMNDKELLAPAPPAALMWNERIITLLKQQGASPAKIVPFVEKQLTCLYKPYKGLSDIPVHLADAPAILHNLVTLLQLQYEVYRDTLPQASQQITLPNKTILPLYADARLDKDTAQLRLWLDRMK